MLSVVIKLLISAKPFFKVLHGCSIAIYKYKKVLGGEGGV